MKKLLLTTTLLVATAGMAAAEVTISGSGRFGVVYDDTAGVGETETQLSYRLRFNIDASTETDAGVTFGGRVRLQYDNGDNDGDEEAGAELSAAYLYGEMGGLRVEVGNANGALDSLNTLFNSEFGFIGTTQGSYNLLGGFAAFSSGPFDITDADRVGVFTQYSVGDLIVRASVHIDDQTVEDDPIGVEDEYAISADYAFGQFSVGGGYAANVANVDGDDAFALLGEYAVNDTLKVGLQYLDFSSDTPGADDSGFTLYASTEYSGIGVGGFISSSDLDGRENDVAYGIGASYDLGGATLAGTIQQTFEEDTYADVGVNFTF